jgi:hypothetical protein
LRRWLIAAGLWQRQRRRDPHRHRRPRRSCFGELVQMDASEHDWLEGRGDDMVLISMVDDSTSYTLARPSRPLTLTDFHDFLATGRRQLPKMPVLLRQLLIECRAKANQDAPQWKQSISGIVKRIEAN